MNRYQKMCKGVQGMLCAEKPHLYIGEKVYHEGIEKIVNGFNLSGGGNEFRVFYFDEGYFVEQWFLEELWKETDEFIFLPSIEFLENFYIVFSSEEKKFNDLMKGLSNFFFEPPVLKINENLSQQEVEEIRLGWLEARKTGRNIIIHSDTGEVEQICMNPDQKMSLKEAMMIFVSNEIFGLKWEFEKEKWVKNRT